MKVTETDDELIIRDRPVGLWIFGGLLVFPFLLVNYLVIDYAIDYPISTFGRPSEGMADFAGNVFKFLIGWAFVALPLLLGLFLISRPSARLYAVRPSQTLEIRKRGLFRWRTMKFCFGELDQFQNRTGRSRTGEYSVLELKPRIGDPVEIAHYDLGILQAEAQTRRFNRFIK